MLEEAKPYQRLLERFKAIPEYKFELTKSQYLAKFVGKQTSLISKKFLEEIDNNIALSKKSADTLNVKDGAFSQLFKKIARKFGN